MEQGAKPLSQKELNQPFAFGVKILIHFFSSNVLRTSRVADIESKGNETRKFNKFLSDSHMAYLQVPTLQSITTIYNSMARLKYL